MTDHDSEQNAQSDAVHATVKLAIFLNSGHQWLFNAVSFAHRAAAWYWDHAQEITLKLQFDPFQFRGSSNALLTRLAAHRPTDQSEAQYRATVRSVQRQMVAAVDRNPQLRENYNAAIEEATKAAHGRTILGRKLPNKAYFRAERSFIRLER